MKKLLIVITVILTISLNQSPTHAEAPHLPEPHRLVESDGVQIAYYFDTLRQGRAGLIHATGDLTDFEVSIFNRRQTTFQLPGYEGIFALIVADMEQTTRRYEIIYRLTPTSGEPIIRTDAITVSSGGFIQQTVTLTEDRLNLIDPEVETAELARIFELATPQTPDILWDEQGFIPPMPNELTSPFGAVRVFNESFNTRHTGWDFQATIGQPIASSATGRVAFTGYLPIRGNYVLVHHGQGIYFGYAHLSVIHVTQGQHVRAGQIVGQVGSTGRSSSAHAHVETIANGHWVDSVDFIRMFLPMPRDLETATLP